MKKIVTLSIFAASVAFAGGDIVAPAPVVEPTPVVAQAPVAVSPWYMGLAANRVDMTPKAAGYVGETRETGIEGILGYDLNDWLSLEGRVAQDSAGAYLKPHMNLIGALDLNGYLGYAKADLNGAGVYADLEAKGFAYGAGLGYGITENLDLILDYIKLDEDNTAKDADMVDLGLSYHF